MSLQQSPLAASIVQGEREQAVNEAQCLTRRHQYLATLKGGILPPIINGANVQRVLDVACGSGIWVQAMAMRYPHMWVVGVDSSALAIEQARIRLPENVSNASYVRQDIHTLGNERFTKASMDLIHMRFLASHVTNQQFGPLLHSLSSLCRRGGILVWTEAELPLTTSSACDYLESLLLSALEAQGRSFSPGFSLSLGLSSRMHWWLRDAKFTVKQDLSDTIPINEGTQSHELFIEELERFAQQIRPFLLHAGVVTNADYDTLMSQLHQEICTRGFQGVFRLRSMVACKL